MLLYGIAAGIAVAFIWSRLSGRPLHPSAGGLVNGLIYVAVALLLRAAGGPPLVAYLWPLPVVALIWLMQRRARRIA